MRCQELCKDGALQLNAGFCQGQKFTRIHVEVSIHATGLH